MGMVGGLGLLPCLCYPFVSGYSSGHDPSAASSKPCVPEKSWFTVISQSNWFYPVVGTATSLLGGAWWFRNHIAALLGFNTSTDSTDPDLENPEEPGPKSMRVPKSKKARRKVTKASLQYPFVIWVVGFVIVAVILLAVCYQFYGNA